MSLYYVHYSRAKDSVMDLVLSMTIYLFCKSKTQITRSVHGKFNCIYEYWLNYDAKQDTLNLRWLHTALKTARKYVIMDIL